MRRTFARALCALLLAPALVAADTLPLEHAFSLARPSEVVLTLSAACSRCDWAVPGREAALLRIDVDGAYSQHVLVTRSQDADGRWDSMLLGPLAAGPHTIRISHDAARSAADIGRIDVRVVEVRSIDANSLEAEWIRRAPLIHARPGTVERFSDVPLAAYAEALPGRTGYRYTIIFSHEDGGTATDRLMATWGRSTDIEFVYEWERRQDGVSEIYQGPEHEILPFKGEYLGAHPLLWVATENNMVSDTGPAGAVRFALVPRLEDLTDVSREMVMDANRWLYAVMSAELTREGRIDQDGRPGSGTIPHPLQFAYLEACGELRDATLAFDVGVQSQEGTIWHATDRGDARFRIARSGCFRAAVPLPGQVRPEDIRALRARAYTRPPRRGETPLPPGTGAATLRRVNTIFMLDETFNPRPSGAQWKGTLAVPVDGAAADIPIR